MPRKNGYSTSFVNQSDNPRASENKGTYELGDVMDLVESGHEVLTDMYEDTFSENTRMILDPIIDAIPVIGAGRDMMDEYVERKDYLEKTGISYDDVVDKQDWNRGISRNIESISGHYSRFAPRGSKSIQDVYSR